MAGEIERSDDNSEGVSSVLFDDSVCLAESIEVTVVKSFSPSNCDVMTLLLSFI